MFGNNSTNVIFKALLALAPATNNLVGLITYTYIDSRNPGIEIPVRNEHFELDTTSTTVLYRFNKSILNTKYIIHNEDTIAHTITLKTERLNNSLDFSILGVFDLDPDETLQYSEELGFQVFTSAGLLKYSAGPTGPAGPPGPPGGLTNIKISAGTLSDLRSDFSFNNGNGVSFGLETNGIITASINTTGGGITNIRVSAGTASTYLSAISFNNSNNVSFGLNGSVITASVFTDYQSTGAYLTTAMLSNAVTLSNINISAGSTSNNLSALSFNNSNGVSFGINGSVITASVETNYQTPGAYLTTAALSQDSSKYAGTNNAMTGGSITVNTSGISINLPVYLTTAQPVGAYLTTAMASNESTNFAGTGSAITNGTMTFDTGGLSLNLSNHLTTARASNDAIGLNSAITANGVSMTANSSGLSLNFPAFLTTAQPVGAYLTTAALSQDSSKYAGINGAMTGGSITVNTSGISVNLPAYLTTAQPVGAYLTTAMLSNAATLSNIKISAGSLSSYRSDISFDNSNGVSFGLETNGAITAIVATNYQSQGAYLTTARASNDAIGLNTALTANGLSVTANSSGLSINVPAWLTTAQPVGAYLTTAMASNQSSDFIQATAAFNGTNASGTIGSNGISVSVNPGSGVAIKGSGAQTQSSGTIEFANSNGITFGLSNNGTMTASHNGLTTAMASNAGSNFVGLNSALTGNGVSATINSSGISLNVPAFLTTAQPVGAYLTTAMASNRGSDFIQAAAAFNGTNASGTIGSNGLSVSVANPGVYYSAGILASQRTNIVFGDANGVSFGLNPTGQITATVQLSHSLGAYAVGNTTQSTSGTMNVNTVSFRGEGIVSVGVSNGSVVISAPSGGGGLTNVNVSAGTTSNNLSNVIFSNANGLSFGLDGSTITASCDGNVTYQGFNPNPNMIQAYVAQGAGTLHVQKMPSAPNFTFDRVVMGLQYSNATNSSNSCTVSLSFGIYSLNASTLSLIGSNSTSFNISNSGTAGSYSLYSGARLITLGMSSSLSAGNYYIGIWSRTTTSGGAGMTINQIARSALNSVFAGRIGLANNASYAHEMGLGVYSVSFSTNMPSAMSMTQIINGTATVVQRQPFYSFAHTTF